MSASARASNKNLKDLGPGLLTFGIGTDNDTMSLKMSAQSPDDGVSNHRSKSSKKDKSVHAEKKRKREHGDESHKKSKKHKGDKVVGEAFEIHENEEEGQLKLELELEVIPTTEIKPTTQFSPEAEASQKSIKSKSKKNKSDREKTKLSHAPDLNVLGDENDILQLDELPNGDHLAIDSKKHKKKKDRTAEATGSGDETRKHKSKKHKVKVEAIESDQETRKSKSKKHRHQPVEVPESEEEAKVHKSKKHRSLPDRTATSSPVPVSEVRTKKSKSKKHKSSSQTLETTPKQYSPFCTQTSSLYLPLAPISQKSALEGLCAEHLSPLILTYYPPFSGVILSYSNPRLSETAFGNDGPKTLLKNIDEYAVSWAWVTAEFLLFKPDKGAWLEGYVNLQNEGHLGVVCWNLFNASIERKRMPKDWKWIGVEGEESVAEGMGETYAEDGIGYWVNGEGIKMDGMVKFRVSEIETSHDKERGFLSIEGTMLDDEAENELLQEEADRATKSRATAGRRLGGLKSKGATSLGVPVESELMDVDKSKRKKY